MARVYPGLSEVLKQALEQVTFVNPDEVRVQPHNKAPVPGIKVNKGFYCPMEGEDGKQCLYVSGTANTMSTHLKLKHKGDQNRPAPKSIKDFPCDYQTLFTCSLKHFYRVQTGYTGLTDLQNNSKNPYLAFLNQGDLSRNLNPPPEPLRTPELPSFLRITQWHNFLEPYRSDPKDVTALIQYPIDQNPCSPHLEQSSEKVLSKLKDVTNTWMDKVHSYWKESTDYVHRVLANHNM